MSRSHDGESDDAASSVRSVVFGKRPITPPKPRVSKLSLMLDSFQQPTQDMINKRRAVKFAKEQDKLPSLQRRFTVSTDVPCEASPKAIDMDRKELRRRGMSFDEYAKPQATRRVVSVRMGTTPRMEWEIAEELCW